MQFERLKRRECITLLGGAAVSPLIWSFAAHAQRSGRPIIAVLGSGAAGDSVSQVQMNLLDAGLRELGLVQGRDYVFEARWAGSDAGRFPALAAELLALRPSAVVVSTNLAAEVVRDLSRTVPIVGMGLNDPIEAGLVASLARPGGNITGVSTMAGDLLLKLIEIMREALPGVRRLTAMRNPTNLSNQLHLDLLTRETANKGLSIGTVDVSSPADLNSAFAELSRQHPGALFVLTEFRLRAAARFSPTVVIRTKPFGVSRAC